MSFVRPRVFIFFALGYFVSFLFRGVNIGFAPYIMQELGLSAHDIGLLTSLYFLSFAAAQIPAGVLLDRYGPRRTVAALLVVAAAGILVFGLAHSLATLMIGRLLIGIGVSVALGGAYKAIAQYFPARHLPLLYGLVLAIGGLGGVLVGTPLLWLLTLVGWRVICLAIALFTLGVAALVTLGTPERAEPDRGLTIRDQLRGTAAILSSRTFWRVAPFSVVTQGVFYAAQSLWVGAYMRDVAGLDAGQAGRLVSILGLAMMAGSVLFGLSARALERRGLSVLAFSGIGMGLFVFDQILIIAGAPLPAWALWIAYGFFGGVGILTYAILAEAFPAGMIGRVNTTLTLLLFITIFVFQAGIGLVLDLWPMIGAHHAAVAHQWVWSGLVMLEVLTAIPYLLPQRPCRAVGPDRPAADADTMVARPTNPLR